MRILVVEDEKATATLVRMLLERELEASVDIAPDCASAREFLSSNSYDLITLDYQLPDGDGLSLLQEIIEREGAPPVIMVTGHGDEQTAVSAFRLGASGYVVKDTRMSTLLVEEARSALARAGQARAELKYKDLYDNAPNAYFSVGTDKRIIRANNRASELTGYTLEQLAGKIVTELYADSPHGKEKAMAVFERFAAGEEIRNEELQLERADGELIWISLSVSQVRDETGSVVESRSVVIDVTDRKATGETMRQSEEKYRTLLATMAEGVVFIEPTGVIAYANPAAEELLGLDRPTIEERHYASAEWEIIRDDGTAMPPEEMAGARAMMEQRRVTGQVMGVRRPDGSTSWISVSASPTIEGSGVLAGVVGTFADITDRKAAEEALREVEERLELSVRGADAGLWDWMVQTGEVVFNDRWAEIVGYTLEELAPVSIDTWTGLCHPDDLRRSGELLERHFAGETEAYECEVRMKHKNGEWVWVLDRGKVFEWADDRKPIRMVGTHMDITERKQAEDKVRYLSSITENISDALLVTDVDFAITYINKASEELYGYTLQELEGKTPDIFNADSMSEQIQRELYEYVPSEKSYVGESLNKKKDGSTFFCEYKVMPLKDDDGRINAYVGIQRDITERKESEEALKRANAELEGYARTVSHDIKGPLSAIALAVETLSGMLEGDDGGANESNAGQALRVIGEGTRRSLALTSDLLALAEAGQASVMDEPVDISEVARSVLQEKEALLEERGVRVSMDDDLGVVAMDPTHAYQLFSNLIGNAIKHNDSENLEISIFHLGEAEQERLRYLVRDNGPGIPEGEREDIFLPFHKGENSTDTGIGLSIVDKIVRLYGGEVRACNDDGACFEFTLPMQSP